MIDAAFLDALECSLTEAPAFLVEQPDGRKHLSELNRCVSWRQQMRIIAPAVSYFPNANAGKRSRVQARREGIVAGVFDYTCVWAERQIAYLEFKGYQNSGRAGSLSQAQVDWGNMMHRLGFPVACFFSPESAIEWLRSLGAPMLRIAA